MGEPRRFSRLFQTHTHVRRRTTWGSRDSLGADVIRFIVLTLAILAWAFWIMSGGSDFEPQERAEPAQPDQTVAAVEPETTDPQPQPATRPEPAQPESTDPVADALTAALAQPDPTPAEPDQPETTASAVAAESAPTDAAPTDTAQADPTPTQAQPAPHPLLDLRMVEASRVNMRSGPSTDYRIVDTLTQGTSVEVKEIDASGDEPWARLIVLATGVEGWMAERFLSTQ